MVAWRRNLLMLTVGCVLAERSTLMLSVLTISPTLNVTAASLSSGVSVGLMCLLVKCLQLRTLLFLQQLHLQEVCLYCI